MNSLYLENSIIGSLFRFFSPYFSAATRPTQFLLTWLVIAQLALQSFPSLRFLHRNFLAQVTHRCLNSYYRALQNETVTSRSLRLQTTELACSLIPAALQNEPVFLSIDDTTVPKFVERVLQYPHLAFICNVRSDSAMYELPPLPSGKPGRPKKRGKRIHLDDFTLSWNMDGIKFGHRIVLTHICGNRRIHAYVSCTASGSRRLFFSTLDPSTLHMSCAWQERKILRDAPAEGMDYYPLKLYKLRWAIETNYYEQKTFWSLNAYRIRRQKGIEHRVNLVNLVHSSLKMLPYLDEHFAKYQNASPQELRSHISWQITSFVNFRGGVKVVKC